MAAYGVDRNSGADGAGEGVAAFVTTFLDADTEATARAAIDVPSNDEAILDAIIDAKGDIIVGTAANTPARKAVGSNGQTLVAASGESDGLIWTDYTREPINVNPNWLIDHINEGALYTVNTTGVNGPDGWSGDVVGAGVFKLRTLADPDNAALKCMEITCTTADASIAATDKYTVYTALEGYDVADLAAGTASASQITLLIRFKSNVTGTYGIAVFNSASNRRYIGTITVADTNVAQYSVTLTLDTTGTWLYTNSIGMYVSLCLAAGSNFQAAAGSWGAGAERTTDAQCNFMSANTNVAYLGRVHIIPGGVALAYHKQDYGREWAKAQRYMREILPDSNGIIANGIVISADISDAMVPLAPTMRAAPSLIVQGVTAQFQLADYAGGAPVNSTGNPSLVGTGADRVNLRFTSTAHGKAAGSITRLTRAGAGDRLLLNARLS